MWSTPNPDAAFMAQAARRLTDAVDGFLAGHRVLICHRDGKWTEEFRRIVEDSRVRVVLTPFQAPNANAYAERFVRSIREECLDHLILFGERRLLHVLDEFVAHYLRGTLPWGAKPSGARQRPARARAPLARGPPRSLPRAAGWVVAVLLPRALGLIRGRRRDLGDRDLAAGLVQEDEIREGSSHIDSDHLRRRHRLSFVLAHCAARGHTYRAPEDVFEDRRVASGIFSAKSPSRGDSLARDRVWYLSWHYFGILGSLRLLSMTRAGARPWADPSFP
jgi:transposase InsO family protein